MTGAVFTTATAPPHRWRARRMPEQAQSDRIAGIALRFGAVQAQHESAAQHAAERRIARHVQHLPIARVAMRIQAHVIAKTDARSGASSVRGS
ncbi:hypothetical protein G6F24_015970 [Rhizopus arrhizus]|nr:hypothetical protein G6F24_015970 [Rhizopus arrhizus]